MICAPVEPQSLLNWKKAEKVKRRSGEYCLCRFAEPTPYFLKAYKENPKSFHACDIRVFQRRGKLIAAWVTKNLGEWEQSAIYEQSEIVFELDDAAASVLWPTQKKAASVLARSVKTHKGALDASDMGTGKTFHLLGAVSSLKLTPIIVCPKTVRTEWKKASALFGITPHIIGSWELFRTGSLDCIDRMTIEIGKAKKRKVDTFSWRLPRNAILIFDEIHRAKSGSSLNAAMVDAAARESIPLLMASATAASNPLDMQSIGYALGLFRKERFYAWVQNYGVRKNSYKVFEFSNDPDHLKMLHANIFPNRGIRIRREELGDKFTQNQIVPMAIDLDDPKKVSDAYEQIKHHADLINERNKDTSNNRLREINRARQIIELLKLEAAAELGRSELEAGRSVIYGVNYRRTAQALMDKLGTNAVIWGNQDDREREEFKTSFQADAIREIILVGGAGSESISLHDIRGVYPRSTIIFPNFDVNKFIQILGRAHRAGGRSDVIQRVLFAAGTIEEECCRRISAKAANIETINNGDLVPGSLLTRLAEIGDAIDPE